MNKCPECGHVDFASMPVVRDTYALLLDRGTLTTSEIAEAKGVSVQNANNRLVRLRELGLAWSAREAQETGGYENVWRPANSHTNP